MNEATINNYKENGIKEYEFMAFLDKKTSPQCRELDGKIISIEEYKAGLNFPPLHPNCRSCIVPVVEDIAIDKPKEEDIKDNTLSPIEELENKGVKVDIDSFKNVDKKLFEENAKQLNKLIDKYQIVKDYLEERSIEFCGKNIKGSAIAQVESNVFKERLLLSLNENFYKNYNEFIEMTTKNIKSGWSSKSKENYIPVRTLTHEFGHIVHECIIHNYNKANPNKLQKVWDSSMKGSLSAGKKKLKDYQLKIVREYNKEMIESIIFYFTYIFITIIKITLWNITSCNCIFIYWLTCKIFFIYTCTFIFYFICKFTIFICCLYTFIFYFIST
jgi:hypothetical protein